MASELIVQTLKGPTSGANANKIIVPSGQTLDASAGFVPPAGTVINAWEVRKADTQTMTGFTYVDISGLSQTITPQSSSSKFLITFNVRASSNYWKTFVNLLRNGSVLFNEAAGSGDSRNRSTSVGISEQSDSNAHGFVHLHSLTILDAPNTTSPVTYKLQGAGRSTGYVMHVNRSVPDRQVTEYDDRMVSNLLIQEIAG